MDFTITTAAVRALIAAARNRLKAGHSAPCPYVGPGIDWTRPPACACGHDALGEAVEAIDEGMKP